MKNSCRILNIDTKTHNQLLIYIFTQSGKFLTKRRDVHNLMSKYIITSYSYFVRYQGTFHAKMGSIKDRNCRDLTEAEDIKKRWQEYTEELYKKIFMTKIIMMV